MSFRMVVWFRNSAGGGETMKNGRGRIVRLAAVVLALALALSAWTLPAAAETAGTTYSGLTQPEVVAGRDEAVKLGSLHIRIEPLEAGYHAGLVSLPRGYELVPPDDASALEVGSITLDISGTGYENEFKMEINYGETVAAATFVLPIEAVIPAGVDGDVKLTVEVLAGQLVDGEATVGRIITGAVTVKVSDPPVIGEFGSTGGAVEVTVTENAAGVLQTGDRSLELILPAGFAWDDANLVLEAVQPGGYTAALRVDPDSDRVLVLRVTDPGERSRSTLRFRVDVRVGAGAVPGEVLAAVDGTSRCTETEVQVAVYAEYGATVRVKEPFQALAGRLAQEIGEIVIAETAPLSLVPGRTVTLTLPAGAKWAGTGTVSAKGGLAVDGGIGFVGDGQTLRFAVRQDVDREVGELTLKGLKVDLAPGLAGDLVVTVGGTAGLSGEVKAAAVVPPVEVSAPQVVVKVGGRDQPAGDITFEEALKGALFRGKDMELVFESYVKLSELPEVMVTAGNLQLDDIRLEADGNKLVLPVKTQSTAASTLVISGIKYDIEPTAPSGPVAVKVGGPAVIEVNDAAALAGITRDYAFGADGIFPQEKQAAVAVNAVATTEAAAPGLRAEFVIGDKTYRVQGLAQEMDVAPYLKDGRTYLPLRYLGLSLGVDPDDIEWDGEAGQATLVREGTTVRVTLGSKVLVVDNTLREMDVTPELVPPGRIMLPYRFIAEAFGAQVDWDPDTQTVMMTI